MRVKENINRLEKAQKERSVPMAQHGYLNNDVLLREIPGRPSEVLRLSERTEVLSKLEDIYLNILRAMVLGIATIALVVFVFAAIQSGPLVSQLVGIEPKAEIADATLETFVSENRASLNAASGRSAGSNATSLSALPRPKSKWLRAIYSNTSPSITATPLQKRTC